MVEIDDELEKCDNDKNEWWFGKPQIIIRKGKLNLYTSSK